MECKLTISSGLALGMMLLVGGCGDQQSNTTETRPLRPVRTLVVDFPTEQNRRDFPAVVDASKKADLSFKIAGKIVKVQVKQGQEVEVGQLLAELDDSDIRIQLNDARASFDKAQADYERARKLIQTQVISQSDFDQLKAQFASAEANLESVRNTLSYTRLHAPFSGVIARKFSENYQEINAKETIFALHDLSRIILKVDIPESLMINAGRNDDASRPRLSASFTALPETSFPLEFVEAATLADESTKTFEVRLGMTPPRDHNILPGMAARVTAERQVIEADAASFVLPPQVVLEDSAGRYVFVVTANEDGSGTVSRKAVSTGEINDNGIEILSGLSQGDRVITAGMSKVSDGLQVSFQP